MANKHTYTVDEIVKILKDEADNETIEGKLLKPKLIRELYKQLGAPEEKDFKDIFKHGYYWDKFPGYTTDITIMDKRKMDAYNNAPTNWRVKYPSVTKRGIVEEYTRDGWHCTVQAYNVICNKYVQHPHYKNICVRFNSTRDCSRYEYIIEND